MLRQHRRRPKRLNLKPQTLNLNPKLAGKIISPFQEKEPEYWESALGSSFRTLIYGSRRKSVGNHAGPDVTTIVAAVFRISVRLALPKNPKP